MPLSQLDPVAALVVIDLQKGIVTLPTVHPMPEIVQRVASLARAFRAAGLPVVLVNVAGRAPGRTEIRRPFSPPPDWSELIAELDRQPSDYIVTKFQIGAFHATGLERILRQANVTQVFLAGVSTSSGVEATARSAYDQGFHVALVVDAMTDLDPVLHHHSVEKTFPRIGETVTAVEALRELAKRSKSEIPP
ncbi:MAG: isochorismatase family cysteine hydrolase [Burkholderiaceae bacterium]